MSIYDRKDVDGLRALAVLPVVLYHASVLGFSGGYFGVDIFLSLVVIISPQYY
jgi:peptidoglycan/LPS O-acetylase OafA/YrhL